MLRPIGESGTPANPPDLKEAQWHLDREIDDVRRKLRDGEEKGAPQDYIDRGNAILAQLNAMTPEQMLAKLLARHDQYLESWRAERFPIRWERFIEVRGCRYADCTFDNYEVTHEGQREVFDGVKRYADELDVNIRRGRNLVLYGTVGTGKDHLLVALAKVAIFSGYTLGWSTGADLFARAKAALESDAEMGPAGLYADVSYISDPVAPGTPGFHGPARLYQLVDGSYSAARPVWCSINAADRAQAVELLGAQVVDRLTDGAVVLKCCWPSHRKPAVVLTGGKT